MPPSILNSRKASSISLLVSFSPQVISEWRNISASIWPLISKASNDLIITWSSSVPPDIFSAKRVTIWVKLMGPGASPTMLFASESLMGHVGGVTPPVVGVVALNDVVVLDFLDHLDLVDTSLAISTRSSSSNSREAHISVVSLTLGTSLKGLDGLAFMVFSMVAMMITMSAVLLAVLVVEGEGVGKGPLVPCSVAVSPQGTSSETSFNKKEKKDSLATRSHIGSKPAGVNTSTAPAGLPC